MTILNGQPENAKEKRPSDIELAESLVKAQMEYFFSDANLQVDKNMQEMLNNKEHVGWAKLEDFMRLPTISRLATDEEVLIKAVAGSKYLVYDPVKKLIQRPGYQAPKPDAFMRDLRRTVYFYGIPNEFPDMAIESMCKLYGSIRRIHWEKQTGDDEGPDQDISKTIMRYKLGSPSQEEKLAIARGETYSVPRCTEDEVKNLKSCYVVFDAQSQANKAVKAYRHQVAIRAITKYEYGKLEKKIIEANVAGIAPEIYSNAPNRRNTVISQMSGLNMGGSSRGSRSPNRMGSPRYQGYESSQSRSGTFPRGNNNNWDNSMNSMKSKDWGGMRSGWGRGGSPRFNTAYGRMNASGRGGRGGGGYRNSGGRGGRGGVYQSDVGGSYRQPVAPEMIGGGTPRLSASAANFSPGKTSATGPLSGRRGSQDRYSARGKGLAQAQS